MTSLSGSRINPGNLSCTYFIPNDSEMMFASIWYAIVGGSLGTLRPCILQVPALEFEPDGIFKNLKRSRFLKFSGDSKYV